MYVRNVHGIGREQEAEGRGAKRRTGGLCSNSVILWVTVVSLRGWANNDIRPTRGSIAATAAVTVAADE
jgi:hypothetical protein